MNKKVCEFMNSHHSATIHPPLKVPIKVPIRVTGKTPNQGHGPGPGEIGVSRMEGFSVMGLFGRFHGGFSDDLMMLFLWWFHDGLMFFFFLNGGLMDLNGTR